MPYRSWPRRSEEGMSVPTREAPARISDCRGRLRRVPPTPWTSMAPCARPHPSRAAPKSTLTPPAGIDIFAAPFPRDSPNEMPSLLDGDGLSATGGRLEGGIVDLPPAAGLPLSSLLSSVRRPLVPDAGTASSAARGAAGPASAVSPALVRCRFRQSRRAAAAPSGRGSRQPLTNPTSRRLKLAGPSSP